jgi:hypothetical protein
LLFISFVYPYIKNNTIAERGYLGHSEIIYSKTIPGVFIFKGASKTSYSNACKTIDKNFAIPEYNNEIKDIKWRLSNVCPWCGKEHNMKVFNDKSFLLKQHSKLSHDKYYKTIASSGKKSRTGN